MHASIIFLHEYMDVELAGVYIFGITAIVITNSSLEWQWEGFMLVKIYCHWALNSVL